MIARTALGRELTIALRSLRRSPTFAATALATMAIASGAVTAIFAVVYAVLLKPLPVVDQGSLALAWKQDVKAGFAHFPFSWPAADAMKGQLPSVSELATIDYNGVWPLSATEDGRGFKLPVGMVSGHFFQLLGVRPLAGRLFVASDDVIGGRRVIVIGESLWRQRYGASANVIGKTLPVAGIPHEIIGVVPGDFAYPRGVMAWMPMFVWQGKYLDNPEAVTQDIVVRLKPGRTMEQFRAELEVARGRTPLERIPSVSPEHQRVVVRSFTDEMVGDIRPSLLLLAAGALIVLTLAAVNIGSLLLVRAGARTQEVAVRAALGGGRGQVLAAVLLEHVLLVIGGVAAGLMLATVGVGAVGAVLPMDLARSRAPSVSEVPIAVGAALGLIVGIVAGLVPALAIVRADLGATLRSGRRDIRGWGTHPVRRLLVASQVAIAVTAVAGTILLVRTLDRLHRIDLGFDPEGLVALDLGAVATSTDTTSQAAWNILDRVVDEIAAVPGVATAAAGLSPPFVGNAGGYYKVKAEGQSDDAAAGMPMANVESVTPGYRAAFGLRLVRGRWLAPSDREGAPSVVVINEALARLLWPGQNPIGRRINGYDVPWRTVVGVVGNTRYNELRTAVPTYYAPYRQFKWAPLFMVVRLDPGVTLAAVGPRLRQAVTTAAPTFSLISTTPIRELIDRPLAPTTITTAAIAGFGVLALGLAAIGVYGILSSFVIQRTREIGLRMALGADGAAVRALVVRQGARMLAGGAAIGFVGALLVGQGLTRFLYEVEPTDPVTMLFVVATLVVVALVAMTFPIYRATRVDPVVALRAE